MSWLLAIELHHRIFQQSFFIKTFELFTASYIFAFKGNIHKHRSGNYNTIAYASAGLEAVGGFGMKSLSDRIRRLGNGGLGKIQTISKNIVRLCSGV